MKPEIVPIEECAHTVLEKSCPFCGEHLISFAHYNNVSIVHEEGIYDIPDDKQYACPGCSVIFVEPEVALSFGIPVAMHAFVADVTGLREDHKHGRNEPCPCGSGFLYEDCCGQDLYE